MPIGIIKIEKVSTDLYEGIDSTLLILKYRLKANDLRPTIQVVKQYGYRKIKMISIAAINTAIDAFKFSDTRDRPQYLKLSRNSVRVYV